MMTRTEFKYQILSGKDHGFSRLCNQIGRSIKNLGQLKQ